MTSGWRISARTCAITTVSISAAAMRRTMVGSAGAPPFSTLWLT